jgi:hypothetical protein
VFGRIVALKESGTCQRSADHTGLLVLVVLVLVLFTVVEVVIVEIIEIIILFVVQLFVVLVVQLFIVLVVLLFVFRSRDESVRGITQVFPFVCVQAEQ